MSDTQQNPWQQLEHDYPEIAQALSGTVEGLLNLSSLDEKIRQLAYITAQTAVCYPLALKYHVPLALKAGATPREVVGAAAIAAAAAGPKCFVTCYPTIKEEIEAYEKEA